MVTDNLETPAAPVDNSQAPTEVAPVPGAANAGIVEAAPDTSTVETTPAIPADPVEKFTDKAAQSWKASLRPDLLNSPLVQKFDDTPEGLTKALESHDNLEKLLGHDKVPIPKNAEDVEGWNRFSKAMGIPDKAEDYGLPDAEIPDSMKDMAIDKNQFAEVVHAHKLTPSQASGLWKVYNDINQQTYVKAMQDHQDTMTETVNRLKGEWGDAYNTNVELGQMVINKFAADQDANDYVTAQLSKDPRGIKFLAKIGDNFAENKVPEFQMKRFSLGPEHAQAEIDKIKMDPKHPYNDREASEAEHNAAVDYVNSLIATVGRARG